jgi:hypothetical protein
VARDDDIRRITEKIEMERAKLDKLDAYFTGRQPLGFLAPEVKEAVGVRLSSLIINWPRFVVGAIEERLDVEGFRLGPGAEPDSELWEMWQANGLDEGSQQGHTEALVHARSYVIVWRGEDEAIPRITIESAKQVYVEHSPGSRARLRALKRWVEDGYAFATLYEPNEITRWRSKSKTPDVGDASYIPADGWVQREEALPNPLGIVPVVPLVNRPRLLAPDGESELTDVLPLADSVSKLATDMMVSSEYHSMPRRWATGIEIVEEPVLDADGERTGETKPATQFSPVAGRTWIAEAPETRFGQFPEASLDGFVHAIELLTQQLSSITGIPPHYLNILKGQLTSAESIRSAEASLVAKARRKQRSFGGSWEEVMRLALLVRDGSLPEGAQRMETVWRDPETRTVAQAADAAVKLVQAGILPSLAALEGLGYTPQQIERIRVMRRQDTLDRVVASLTEGIAP